MRKISNPVTGKSVPLIELYVTRFSDGMVRPDCYIDPLGNGVLRNRLTGRIPFMRLYEFIKDDGACLKTIYCLNGEDIHKEDQSTFHTVTGVQKKNGVEGLMLEAWPE